MSVSKSLNILIVSHESFPNGMGATNRIISWSSILATNGVPIKVYIVKPTEKDNDIQNIAYTGIYKDVKYEYLNKTTIWPKQSSKIKKLSILTSGYYQLVKKLFQEKPTIIITYTSDIYTKIILYLIRPILNYKIVIEETEYPKVLKRKKQKYLIRFTLSLYQYSDGMIVMTKELLDYYKGIGAKNIFLLPMTVDNSRFQDCVKKAGISKNLVYVGGSGGFMRDGVLDIVKAFHIFSLNNPEFKLFIVGPIDKSNQEYHRIERFISENKLMDRVQLKGALNTNEIPDLLANATGIVMAPPKDFVSGGFPTKLGEFLASGSPVICTRISDIPQYLNETNSFLANPGDIYSLSEAMENLISDDKKSHLIGLKGKELAQSVFNAETYLNPLLTFLNNLFL